MRQSHIDEIENLTRAVTKIKELKNSDDKTKDMSRKLKRDNDELKIRLMQRDQEVEELREERGHLKN
jgi:hypothetical protein